MQPDYVAIDRIATTYAAFNMAFDTGTALFWTKYSDVILEKIEVATIKSQFRAFLLHNSKNKLAITAGEILGDAMIGKTVGEVITMLKRFATSEVASKLNKDFEEYRNLQQQKR